MPIVASFGGLSAFGFGAFPGGDFESIATVTVGSGGASSIEFTSIPSTFAHLQVRMIARTSISGTEDTLIAQLNSDTGSNYAWHGLVGTGSAAVAAAGSSQNHFRTFRVAGNTETASVIGAGVIDILDYADTSKNTTVRTFGGMDGNGNGQATLYSGLWASTSAVTSIKIYANTGPNLLQHSTAALFGVKAP